MRTVLAGLLCLTAISSPGTALAQSADYYSGTVVNSNLRGQPARLELSIYSRTDTAIVGWLSIGAPLGGSGFAAVVPRDLDSLYLVSVSVANDTIVWVSGTRTGTIGGTYWIKGGQFAGQEGTWRLEPQPHLAATTLSLIALFIAVGGVLLIYIAATQMARSWWRRRDADTLSSLPPDQLEKLNSVGGWLTLVVVANALVVLYLIVNLGEIRESLGSTWMLAAAIPGMRKTLMIESAVHLLQILGLGTGIVLILRKSPHAPPFWVVMLVVFALAAIHDISVSSTLAAAMTNLVGADSASEGIMSMRQAESQNMQLVMRSAIWGLYWLRSKRVRVVFSPTVQVSAATPVAVATEPA